MTKFKFTKETGHETEEAAFTAAANSAKSFIDLSWEQYALETGNPAYDDTNPDSTNPENTSKYWQWFKGKNFKDFVV